MKNGDRVKRTTPPRTGPIRSFETLFGESGAGVPRPAEPAPGDASSPNGAPRGGDPIARGVDLGYRVIDAYMREGQKAARRMWGPFTGAPSATPDVQQRLTSMFRQTADLAAMWFDLTSAMGIPGLVNGATPAAGSVVAGPFKSGEAASGGAAQDAPSRVAPSPEAPSAARGGGEEPAMVAIDIASRKPASVSIDLRPQSPGTTLRVHDLRDIDPDKPRLQGAKVEVTDEGVRVRVRVPDDFPPGTYAGVILDERTSLPRGVLSVRVSEPE